MEETVDPSAHTYARPNPDVVEVEEDPLPAASLIVIGSYHSLTEAEMACSALRGSSVRASLRDQHTVGANMALGAIVGGVKVMVPKEDRERAEEILAQQKSNQGRPVFMVLHRAYLGLSFAGMLGGLFVGGVLVMITGSPLVLVASTLVGAMIGWWRASVAKPYCSSMSCGAPLELGMTVCPKCAGLISGTIAHPDERLEAEEQLRIGG